MTCLLLLLFSGGGGGECTMLWASCTWISSLEMYLSLLLLPNSTYRLLTPSNIDTTILSIIYYLILRLSMVLYHVLLYITPQFNITYQIWLRSLILHTAYYQQTTNRTQWYLSVNDCILTASRPFLGHTWQHCAPHESIEQQAKTHSLKKKKKLKKGKETFGFTSTETIKAYYGRGSWGVRNVHI